jgi:fused signal recognition particle receptor
VFSFIKKSLQAVSSGIQAAFKKLSDRPDAQSLEELETVLLAADLGLDATNAILGEVGNERQKNRSVSDIAKEVLRKRLEGIETPFHFDAGLQTILIVGINGAGKTTTVAKLAANFKAMGRNPLIASADTFRAAANEQLSSWAARAGVPLIESRTGADPAAVAFDALKAAQSRAHDTLIVDTAGRLHNKESLMTELTKIDKAIKKLDSKAPQHRLLVVDATLGLNSLAQAKAFSQAIKLSGLIVTKLDGSAKAGVLVPLFEELKLPVYFVGVGEKIDELKPFVLQEYLEGLLG